MPLRPTQIVPAVLLALMFCADTEAFQSQARPNFPSRLIDAIDTTQPVRVKKQTKDNSDRYTQPERDTTHNGYSKKLTPVSQVSQKIKPLPHSVIDHTPNPPRSVGKYRGTGWQSLSAKPQPRQGASFTFNDTPKQATSDFGTVMTFPAAPSGTVAGHGMNEISSAQEMDAKSVFENRVVNGPRTPDQIMTPATTRPDPIQNALIEQVRIQQEQIKQLALTVKQQKADQDKLLAQKEVVRQIAQSKTPTLPPQIPTNQMKPARMPTMQTRNEPANTGAVGSGVPSSQVSVSLTDSTLSSPIRTVERATPVTPEAVLQETALPEPPAALKQFNLKTSVVGPEALVEGRPDVFEIVVINKGDETATDLIVQMVVPAEITVSRIYRQAWLDEKQRTVSWKIPRIEAGSQEVIRFSGVGTVPGQFEHKVLVGVKDAFQGETDFGVTVITQEDYTANYDQ